MITGLQKKGLISLILLGVTACSSVPKLPLIGGKDKNSTVAVTSLVNDPASSAVVEPQTPPAPKFFSGDLLGLEASQIDGLLGTPSFVRREGQGQFRRYDGQKCNLIVLLTRDASGRIVSTGLEAASFFSSSGKPDLQECLNGF